MQPKKEINVIVGANIKKWRENAGLTQDQLSEAMGIGEKSLSAIERGVVGISLTQLKNVCELLSVTSDALIFGSSESNNIESLARRFEKLTPEQYRIVDSIMSELLKAFRLRDSG